MTESKKMVQFSCDEVLWREVKVEAAKKGLKIPEYMECLIRFALKYKDKF